MNVTAEPEIRVLVQGAVSSVIYDSADDARAVARLCGGIAFLSYPVGAWVTTVDGLKLTMTQPFVTYGDGVAMAVRGHVDAPYDEAMSWMVLCEDFAI